MSWKSKMYILSNLLGQVDRFPPVEFFCRATPNRQPRLELVETGHTSCGRKIETTGHKKPAAGQPCVQFKAKRGACLCAGLFKPEVPGLSIALKVQSATLRNLAQMNLHGCTLNVEVGTFNAQVAVSESRSWLFQKSGYAARRFK
jgi:hypothetical protein